MPAVDSGAPKLSTVSRLEVISQQFTDMQLGAAIKKMRRKSGLSQKEFARRVDITQSYLSQIENDQKEPNLSTLRQISEEMGVSVPILFFLSMDSDDVRPDRKEAFDRIFPRFKGIIEDQLLADA